MSPRRRLYPSRIAVVAACVASMVGGAALAQPVQVFDQAPSLEQLRSIMIPESLPGAGRTIVIQRPDMPAPAANVQRANAEVAMPSAPPARAAERRPAAVEQAVAETPPVAPARAKPAAPANPPSVGMRINFAFNSAVLPESARAMIDRVAEVMKEAADIKVRIEGHTDAVGSAEYNMPLSERRARSVGEYLVKLGIDPSRLMLIGKGMADPLTANPYDPNNRRVQFVRVG
jgi:outer membrane protein OmpA-like peptidoglycan-associated protein